MGSHNKPYSRKLLPYSQTQLDQIVAFWQACHPDWPRWVILVTMEVAEPPKTIIVDMEAV